MTSPRHLLLATLVVLAGCDMNVTGSSGSTGPACFISCTPATTAPEGYKIIAIAPINGGSVSGGSIVIRNLNQAAPEIDGIVTFYFANVGAGGSGARYPMHIHKGTECSTAPAPIVHDLGAPISAETWVNIPTVAISREHLLSGYYFDVHAANDPTGAPVGCAVFPW